MKVLVLGGTGSIGGPVVRELIRAGHEVVALARSAASATAVARIGARPITGDMADPEPWLAAVRNIRFIYTGGCWLYGESDERRATTEATPFDPLPAFAWGVAHCRLVLEAPGIDSVVIHPAMVYLPCGGCLRSVPGRCRRAQRGADRRRRASALAAGARR
ncbi:MAG: NAD(P)H-binding protein [Steroidobacteraceae bacterium]